METLNETVLIDTAHEKLFVARLYEALAKIYDDNGNKNNLKQFSTSLFEEYPQLVPFSGIKMAMKLVTTGADDKTTQTVVNDLKNCNINWMQEGNSGPVATAIINFVKKGSAYEATVSVTSASGKIVTGNQRLIFKQSQGVGGEIGLRLFGKGGALVFDPAPTP